MRGWVTRDENGVLYFHTNRPYKFKAGRYWTSLNCKLIFEEFFEEGYFSNVKWEDEEPTECEYWYNRYESMAYIKLITK